MVKNIYCLNSFWAVPKVHSLSESLSVSCVRLKAAVNNFLPCRHGQNGCHCTQIGGWLKRRGSKRKIKCCFSMVLSSAPLMRLTLTSAFHPVVITVVVWFFCLSKWIQPIEDLVHLMQITIIPTFLHFQNYRSFILYDYCCYYIIIALL